MKRERPDPCCHDTESDEFDDATLVAFLAAREAWMTPSADPTPGLPAESFSSSSAGELVLVAEPVLKGEAAAKKERNDDQKHTFHSEFFHEVLVEKDSPPRDRLRSPRRAGSRQIQDE